MKNDELPANIADWPEEWRFNFRERWAIMNIDGEIEMEEARKLAEESTRESYRQMRAWQKSQFVLSLDNET